MRFSLKTLFIAVTVVAVLCGVAFAPPHWIGVDLLFISLVFAPPVLVSGAVYLRGKRQAFCIGSATMSFLVAISIFGPIVLFIDAIFSDPIGFLSGEESRNIIWKIYQASMWVLIVISGFLGIGMRYLSRRIYQTPAPPRSSASSAVPPFCD